MVMRCHTCCTQQNHQCQAQPSSCNAPVHNSDAWPLELVAFMHIIAEYDAANTLLCSNGARRCQEKRSDPMMERRAEAEQRKVRGCATPFI
jgi:hypothetical protein